MQLVKRLLWTTLIGFPISGCHASASAGVQTITVDASHVVGAIKRVNDVGNGPLNLHGAIDLSKYYRELGIRNVRLHDASWSYDDVLDINYIFPRWDADPDKPESYDFAQSDFYIKSITDLGINIIFRLGYSAEYKTPMRHSTPPDSFEKWADICAHIVRHYNQGWANGPKAHIRYWEIGNEPDGRGLVFWSGTPEEFYRLYAVTARKLKEIDPALKVGGPAIAGSLPFLEGMLQYSQEHGTPVDFVSWHIYTRDPHEIAESARRIHAIQGKYGYAKAESILDEWNMSPVNWGTIFDGSTAGEDYFAETKNAVGAAFDATVMIELQDEPADIATFYTGTTQPWGLFSSSGAPQPAYYSFLAMQRLMETPERLEVMSAGDGGPSVLAGVSEDKKTVRILVAELAGQRNPLSLQLRNLPWDGPSVCERRAIDASHNLSIVETGQITGKSPSIFQPVLGPAIILFTIRPASQ
jgi:xylan 1,4-beta-xylosidase